MKRQTKTFLSYLTIFLIAGGVSPLTDGYLLGQNDSRYIHGNGPEDRFYRFSNDTSHYDAVYTNFGDQNSNYVPLEDEEADTTYTGTSIPPGINDGYNATPSGRYKNSGGQYPSLNNLYK